MPLANGQRRRALAILLTGLWGVAAANSAWNAHAQSAPGIPGIGSSTTTEAPSETTTTSSTSTTSTTAAPALLGPTTTTSTTTSTSTTQPPNGGGGAPPPADSPPPASPSAGDGGTPTAGAGPYPPELQALTNSIRRSPANDTKALVAALAPLQQFGLDATAAAVVGFGRFPIAGLASYSHDWWYPRFGPGWRLHEGTDIFADFDTPVRAPVDGTVKITNGGLGGVSVYVVQPDGTYWYLAHLAGTVQGLATGATVETGEVVGFVGNSGNAAGGPPHVHIQIHPAGGAPIDPKPILDQFINDAIALAPKVIDAYAQARSSDGSTPVVPKLPTPAAVAPQLSRHATLLWAAAVSPTGGALQFATDEAAHVAERIDWATRPADDGPSRFDRQMARQYAVWWVEPLVHPLLARHLTSRSGAHPTATPPWFCAHDAQHDGRQRAGSSARPDACHASNPPSTSTMSV